MWEAQRLILEGWPSQTIGVLDPDMPAIGPVDRYLLLRFHDVPRVMRGMTAPTTQDVVQAFEAVSGLGPEDRVLVHCMTGTGRGPAMGIAVLVSLGLTPSQAVERIGTMRPNMAPNERVIRIAERQLDCRGAIATAIQAWRDASVN